MQQFKRDNSQESYGAAFPAMLPPRSSFATAHAYAPGRVHTFAALSCSPRRHALSFQATRFMLEKKMMRLRIRANIKNE
jgi:hypothetical protein